VWDLDDFEKLEELVIPRLPGGLIIREKGLSVSFPSVGEDATAAAG
jgi:hypothetical protein